MVRIENEQVSNPEGYRKVLEIPEKVSWLDEAAQDEADDQVRRLLSKIK